MSARLHPVFTRLIKRLAIAASSLFFCTEIAHAVTINFDDLTYVPDPDFPCFCDNPLTDEYLSKGLRIDGGFLVPADPVGNGLIGTSSMTLSFVGAFPTFVSMLVSAPNEDVIYLDAYQVSGSGMQKKTAGWAGPFDDTPYVPKQLISFASSDGFTAITLQGFYNSRVEAFIDDLTFTYASDIPEPSSMILLGVGLIFIVRRYSLS